MEPRWDSSVRNTPGNPAPSQPRATRTYSHKLKSSRLFRDDKDLASERSLHSRAGAEHVVLANCRSSNGVLSSEMAYFSGSPKSKPDDTTIVDTSYNITRQWANARTSTLFPDTNTTFTAVLRPDVAQGAWAGTGDNGYGTFVCWETNLPELYYDGDVGTECSGVYDCDHEATPSKCLCSAFTISHHLEVFKSILSWPLLSACEPSSTGVTIGRFDSFCLGTPDGHYLTVLQWTARLSRRTFF